MKRTRNLGLAVIALCTVVTGWMGSHAKACYVVEAQKCASINETTCKWLLNCGGIYNYWVDATATADAWIYPARTAQPGESGIDATIGYPGCTFPAVALDCDNQPYNGYCGPDGSYATGDYEHGNGCTVY